MKFTDDREQLADPWNIDTQIRVWDAYTRLRSMRATAAETGVPLHTVRQVLDADRRRLNQIIDDYHEQIVAAWEQTEHESIELQQQLLKVYRGMIEEIMQAAAEGRATRIRHRDGYDLPVLDAINFLVASRALDQVSGIAAKARAVASAYRTGGATTTGDDTAATDFEKMNDVELARAILAGGMKLPHHLEMKAKKVPELAVLVDKTGTDQSP